MKSLVGGDGVGDQGSVRTGAISTGIAHNINPNLKFILYSALLVSGERPHNPFVRQVMFNLHEMPVRPALVTIVNILLRTEALVPIRL